MDGVSPVAEAAFISLEGGGNVQTAISDLQAGGGGGEGGGLSLSQVQDVVAQALLPYSLSTEITAEIAAAIANIPASETGGGEIGITIDDVNNAIAQALFPYRPAAETDTAIADAIAAALLPYATTAAVSQATAAFRTAEEITAEIAAAVANVPAGEGGGLTAQQVDDRIRAGVKDFAETENTGGIPEGEIPAEIARTANVEIFARVGNPAEIVPPEKMVATAQAAIGGSILQLVVNPTTQARRNAYIRAGAAVYDPDNNGNPLITSIAAMTNAPYGVSQVRLPQEFIGGRGINNRGRAGLEGMLITNYGGANSIGRTQLLYSNRGDYRRTDFAADWETAIGLTEDDVGTLITNGVEVWARTDNNTLIPPQALSPIVLERSGSSFGANVLTGGAIAEGQAAARTVAIAAPTGDTIKFTLENPQHHIRYVDILITDISASEHSVFVQNGISINIRRVGGGDQFNLWFSHADVNGYSITTIRRSFADGDFVHASDIADFRTETQINNLIAAAIANIPPTDLSQYRTAADITAEINAAIANIPAADLSDYRTAAQITAEITAAIDGLSTPATWARSGNTGAIPDSKIPASIARDTEVSSRISAEVAEWAHTGDGTIIPVAKIPPEIARDTEVAEAINTGVEPWAIVGDGTIIPTAKLPAAAGGNPQSIRRVDGFASVINGVASETVAFRIVGADVLGLPAGEYILEAWEDSGSGNDTGQRATNYTTGRVYLRHNLSANWAVSDLFAEQAIYLNERENRFFLSQAQSIDWGNNGGTSPRTTIIQFTADARNLPPTATYDSATGLILPAGQWRASFNCRVNPATRGNNVRVIAAAEIISGGTIVGEQSVYIRNGQFGGTNYENIEGRISVSGVLAGGIDIMQVQMRIAVQSAGMTVSLSDVRFTGERVL